MTTQEPLLPYIGMGATVQHWSDRSATTVIQITYNGKRIVLQRDKAIRIDQNGMSESQEYSYVRDEEGELFFATKRKDGTFRLVGTKTIVSLGVRNEYYDFSF
jgi:hypothetical protein